MAEIVTLGLVSEGYCANCAEPATVGALQIKGWPHEPNVCASCLGKLMKRLEARAENSEPDAKGKKP